MPSKFARTMDQAFPTGADYGCAVKIAYRRPLAERIIISSLYVAFGVFCFGSMLALMLAYFDVLVP